MFFLPRAPPRQQLPLPPAKKGADEVLSQREATFAGSQASQTESHLIHADWHRHPFCREPCFSDDEAIFPPPEDIPSPLPALPGCCDRKRQRPEAAFFATDPVFSAIDKV